jgi:hypothetical protein
MKDYALIEELSKRASANLGPAYYEALLLVIAGLLGEPARACLVEAFVRGPQDMAKVPGSSTLVRALVQAGLLTRSASMASDFIVGASVMGRRLVERAGWVTLQSEAQQALTEGKFDE